MKQLFSLISFLIVGLLASAAQAGGGDYKITGTNMLETELLAPVLIAPVRADRKIFDGDYVTSEAEHQILTGDPAQLVAEIGKSATVGHGTDGPPGVLLAPGKSVTIMVKAHRDSALRVLAMVAPTEVTDHFVTAIINPKSMLPVMLDRYDIGHDEGTLTTSYVMGGAAKITIEADKM